VKSGDGEKTHVEVGHSTEQLADLEDDVKHLGSNVCDNCGSPQTKKES